MAVLSQEITLAPSQLVAVLAALLPTPAISSIESEMQMDRNKNPHGDSYKPKQRGKNEVIADLRVAEAEAIYRATMRLSL